MKKEYDFSKAYKRADKKGVVDPESVKFPTSMRLDGGLIAWYKTEAERTGIPYQTIMSSVLHRFATFELVDKAQVKRIQKSKGAS